MKPSRKCIDLIKQFEGFRLDPYLDSVGIPTIGYGSTYYLDDITKVTLQDSPITPEMAEELLSKALESLASRLDSSIEIDLNQNQLDALLSLVYNIGMGAFKKSTLLRLLNRNDLDKASEQFLVWCKAGGKVLPGLSHRRAIEQKLFLE